FTWWAAVIATAVMALPLMVKSARAAIESVNPQFEIASYTLGKSELETFFRITLPLASRGLFAGVVLSFARALGEFGATLRNSSKIEKNRRPRELLAILGIEYAARQYPRELSGGESQRVALARALATDPAIVLLDEPLSAVDAETRDRLLHEIGD